MKEFSAFQISPLSRKARIEDEVNNLYKHEFRELVRGFCGALFVALPLLYTMEMWTRARTIPPLVMVTLLVLAYIAGLGFVAFSGFKCDPERRNLYLDSAVSLLIGLVASFVTLFLTARITLTTPINIILSMCALMAIPTSIGASLAINQLGKRGSGTDGNPIVSRWNEDLKIIVATALGGILFAFNIVPTLEPKIMLAGVTPEHALAIVVFSLIVSYAFVYTAQFHTGEEDDHSGVLEGKILATAIAYIVSLITSAGLLWAFGYLNSGTPPEMWVIWVVIVGYSTTIGGAAGRVIL